MLVLFAENEIVDNFGCNYAKGNAIASEAKRKVGVRPLGDAANIG